jgi:HEAT repeat protein
MHTCLTLLCLASADSSAGEMERLWDALKGPDARVAQMAVIELARRPAQGVPFLAGKLSPPPAEADLPKLIADLGAERYVVRKSAMRKLSELGETAVPALRERLGASPTLEVRRRIEELLALQERREASEEGLRVMRAVQALERAGTPEARHLLGRLAASKHNSLLRREASDAVERLGR